MASHDIASGGVPAPAARDAGTPPVQPMDELAPSACWEHLRSTPIGRLAVRGVGDDVEVFPVNYLVDHGTIVFRTAAGTKLDRIVATSQSTFEADGVDAAGGGAGDTAWSVIAKGPCAVIQERDDVVASFDVDVSPWHAGGKPTFVRLTPHTLTGRRFTIDTVPGATDTER